MKSDKWSRDISAVGPAWRAICVSLLGHEPSPDVDDDRRELGELMATSAPHLAPSTAIWQLLAA